VTADQLGLVASQSLGVLDELRIPYVTGGIAAQPGWGQLGGGRSDATLNWPVRSSERPGLYWIGEVAIWGRLAPEPEVEALARQLDGDWVRDLAVRDGWGLPRSHIWRTGDGGTILPFDPDEVIRNIRSEAYRRLAAPRKFALGALARRAYYALRPLLPRSLQIGLRRSFARVQRPPVFPRWPFEPALHDLIELVADYVADAAGEPVPYLQPWPGGHSWALVLTHDVETAQGVARIAPICADEEAAGYRSSWNLVPERYRIDRSLVQELDRSGFEVGVHGLRHDGRDLESRRMVERRLPAIRRVADEWGSVGFRAPATQRIWNVMPELGFGYDSSYPDTDPYEPIAGGCCTWWPFFNDELVELPITVPQDHTIFVILGRDESVWLDKVAALRTRGGMALLVTHPDYFAEPGLRDGYRRLLEAYRHDASVWKALPREVAEWWRRRAATSIEHRADGWVAVGPAAGEASVGLIRGRAQPVLASRPVVRA
jgi:hypothetical protein